MGDAVVLRSMFAQLLVKSLRSVLNALLLHKFEQIYNLVKAFGLCFKLVLLCLIKLWLWFSKEIN